MNEIQLVKSLQDMLSGPIGQGISIFAGRYLIFVFAFLVAVIGFGKKRKELRMTAYAATWSALLALIITTSLGMLIERPRPFVADPSIVRLIPAPLTEHSMPSAHTATAFGAATALAFGHPVLGLIAFLIAGLIGIGRVASGVHFPTDILAGAILGCLVAIGVRLVRSKRWKYWMEIADESDPEE